MVPPQQVKIAQSVIVQYVAPSNMLWYAPYCTIEGAADIWGEAPGMEQQKNRGLKARSIARRLAAKNQKYAALG